MCNYYETPEPNVFTNYFLLLEQVPLPLPKTKGVGPFGEGIFLRPVGRTLKDGLQPVLGQWGMIRPGSPERWDVVVKGGVKTKQRRYTNNCRFDSIVPPEGKRPKPTFAAAWAKGQRCLVPMEWYQDPNWETKRNIWWSLKRADGMPWAIAGLWSEWTDPKTGEVVPNFTVITVNCDNHTLLNRLHKPDPTLPADQQDKRSLVHVHREDWQTWLFATAEEAAALLVPAPEDMFDRSDAVKTDEILARLRAGALVPPPTAQQDELFAAEQEKPDL
jgi:putative SOS response-associated peptidase YedK